MPPTPAIPPGHTARQVTYTSFSRVQLGCWRLSASFRTPGSLIQLLLTSSWRRLWLVSRRAARLLQPLLVISQSPSLGGEQGRGRDRGHTPRLPLTGQAAWAAPPCHRARRHICTWHTKPWGRRCAPHLSLNMWVSQWPRMDHEGGRCMQSSLQVAQQSYPGLRVPASSGRRRAPRGLLERIVLSARRGQQEEDGLPHSLLLHHPRAEPVGWAEEAARGQGQSCGAEGEGTHEGFRAPRRGHGDRPKKGAGGPSGSACRARLRAAHPHTPTCAPSRVPGVTGKPPVRGTEHRKFVTGSRNASHGESKARPGLGDLTVASWGLQEETTIRGTTLLSMTKCLLR